MTHLSLSPVAALVENNPQRVTFSPMQPKDLWQSPNAQLLLLGGLILGLVVLLTPLMLWVRGLEGSLTKAEARAWIMPLLFLLVALGSIIFLNTQANQRHRESQKHLDRRAQNALAHQRDQAEMTLAQQREQAEANRVQQQQYHTETLQQHQFHAEEERKQHQEQAERDRQEQREQTAYQAYLKQISLLFIDQKIALASVNSEVFQFAQALTADILRSVGQAHRNKIIFLLRSLTLAETDTAENMRISSLLSGIQLDNASLRNLQAPHTNFAKAHLIRADLRGAVFMGANLNGAYLEKTILTGAYLEQAYFYGAYLNGAYLEGAYLVGANLVNASLRTAKLIGANLEGANLEGANLSEANLENANLRGANLDGTYLVDAVFRNTTLPNGTVRDG
ncbi:MAG: pentapeptide repeat-containing protein [Spirulinaceae cyanobacterium]